MRRKLYLAARYERREEMLQKAEDLKALGHKIVSSWIDGHHEKQKLPDGTYSPIQYAGFALEDVDDLRRADSLVVFTEDGPTRGGFRTEMGIVIGWNLAYSQHFPTSDKKIKTLNIVGPRPVVFDHLPYRWLRHFPSWEDVLEKWWTL